MMTPSFGRELSRERAESLTAEGRGGRRSRRARLPRRYVRKAVGVRLVNAGLHLIGGEEVR
jgi:hypothetical protein